MFAENQHQHWKQLFPLQTLLWTIQTLGWCMASFLSFCTFDAMNIVYPPCLTLSPSIL